MWHTYVFNTELVEEPYDAHGDIGYRDVYYDNRIKVNIDIDNNIDFESGIIGYGFNTDDIKDYETLLVFLYEHYDEIEEDDYDNSSFTRKECIDELIDICKEKIKLEEPTKEKDFERALRQIQYLTSQETCYMYEGKTNFRAICYNIANEILRKYESN